MTEIDPIQRAVDVQRQIDAHDRRLNSHGEDIQDLQLWRAQIKGFLFALTIFASLPTVILGWAAVTGAFAK